MAHSGEILDLKSLNKIIVDKHSTGGVGDKVSICLLPLVASLGVPVAKITPFPPCYFIHILCFHKHIRTFLCITTSNSRYSFHFTLKK